MRNLRSTLSSKVAVLATVTALLAGLVIIGAVAPSPASAASGDVLYRVNVGGGQQGGTPTWTRDTRSAPSSYLATDGTTYTSSVTTMDASDPSIPAGTPSVLFRTQRYDKTGGSDMAWSFPTAPGYYTVRLYFAEPLVTMAAPGKRIFDVQAEGKVMLNDLDVYAAAGALNKGIMRSFDIATDGPLDLTFLRVKGNPMVSAIEILEATPPPPTLASSASPVAVTLSSGTQATRSFTVTNAGAPGAASIAVSGLSVSGTDATRVQATLVGGPTTLAVGASATVDLQVDAQGAAAGPLSASVTIAHDGANQPLVVPIAVTVAGTFSSNAVLYRVNAGGGSQTGSPPWAVDTRAASSPYGVVPGTTYTSSVTTMDASDPSVPVGTPSVLFRTQRYAQVGAPDMKWSFPTIPGSYTVRLYFAEPLSTNNAVGKRVFDVNAEGQTALDDVDVYATALALNKGIVRSFQVTADDSLDLDFVRGASGNPMVSAIEIIAAQAPAQLTVAPTSVSFADTDTGATTTETVTVTNTAASGSKSLTVSGTSITGSDAASFSDTFNDASPVVLAPGASTTFDVSFSPSTTGAKSASLAIANDGPGGAATVPLSGTATTGSTPGEVLFRVNVGGPQVAGTPVWSADQFNNPSPYVNGVTNFFDDPTPVTITDPSVPAGTPAAIFQDQRYDVSGGSEMSWSFPVTPGDYEVRLYFAENYAPLATPGSRVFDVQAEGQTVVDNLDVGQAAGGAFKGIARTFTVTADSSLDLTWVHGVENPLVQGIEILSTSGSGTIEPTLGASPNPVSFGTTSIGDTTNRTVTVTNTGANGAGSLDLTGATITGADANQFAVTFAGPVTLAVGQSTNLSVDFSPTTSGSKSASLNLAHTGSNPTVSIPLTGTAPSGDGSTVLFRVNAGGPAVSGSPTWTGDTQGSPSPYALNGNAYDSGQTVDISDPSIPAGTPASIFRDERYDGANEQWRFPTGAGNFQVRLYFAETSPAQSSVGARVMDVSVEGNLALDNFDQFSEAGAANKGIMRSVNVTAVAEAGDAQPDIEVSIASVVDVAALKAIEVVIPPVVAPTTVGASPVSIAFGNTTIGQTQSRTVTLTNQGAPGSGAVTITNAAITGPWAEEFSENYDQGNPVVLAPGASTTIDVTHQPTTAGIDNVSLEVTTTGVNSPIEIPITGSGVYPPSGSGINFGKSTISGITGTSSPTSIKWGPDGRLYIARLDGTVQVATIVRNGPNDYSATAVDTITSIRDIPNHDDNGQPNPAQTGRLVTGLEVVGTAQNPIIYLVSSDPRIGSPQTTEAAMDTNSGILSSLRWDGSSWVKRDLIAGFPRSKEQHSVEGVVKDPTTGHLLLMSGGQTNHGAPSDNFKDVPEYALSAAILDVDIAAVEALPGIYNLPTLDDEDRPGVNDLNDPFGGNSGKNQAKLVPGGPVQIYASGLRNAYDSVYTSKGLYTADNGGNASWGGAPANEGPQGTCTNAIDNSGPTYQDGLYQITGPGQYFGHPNPTRGNMANTFNASNPQSPVSVADARECDFWTMAERPALAHFTTSSNGIDQYQTNNFGGAMNGDLLVAGWDNQIHLVELNADGSAGKSSTLAQNIGAYVLDIITGKATDPFPGSMTVADYGTNSIYMFEPTDFDGTPPACTGANSALLDEDHDGFTNADEILNGTNPCSGADLPADFDGDHVSNKLDTDDDNDGNPDVTDPFAVDPDNGLTTAVGLNFPWNSDTPQNSGILNLGLTGSMINGTTDWLSTYDETNMTIIGAAGVVTVDATPSGTALGAANTQMYGLQVGFDPRPASTGTFEAATSLPNPYGSQPPLAGQSWGLQLGKGDQDNYMKIVASGANGGQMELVQEINGVATTLATAPLAMPGPQRIDIFIKVDPVTKLAQAAYAVRANNVTGPKTDLGTPFAVPAGWFNQGMAAGLIATSGGAATPLTASWDFLQVLPVAGSINAPLALGPASSDPGPVPSSTTTTTAPIVATLPSGDKQ